jgi:hypothetical protein
MKTGTKDEVTVKQGSGLFEEFEDVGHEKRMKGCEG